MPHPQITLSEQTIHNPGEPRHFMRLKPVGRPVQILRGDVVLARTGAALRLLEVGRDFYDPTIYVPQADVIAGLRQTQAQTHCPLKGDAVYFDLIVDGAVAQPEIAWSYPDPPDFALALAGHIAFYPHLVTIIEGAA